MARRRGPAGSHAERGRLLWDAWAWLHLLDLRRRLDEGELTGHWAKVDAAVDRTVRELLTADDFDALRRIVVGDGRGCAHEQLVALAGPKPGPDRSGVGPAIAERAGVQWLPGVGYTTD